MVDAGQGVEAQSVANCYTAIEQGLEVMPVLNKIDLPQADPDRVKEEIEKIIGIDATDAVGVQRQNRPGCRRSARASGAHHSCPTGNIEDPLQALIIDSWFDNYLGVCRWCACVMAALKRATRSSSSPPASSIWSTALACSTRNTPQRLISRRAK